MNPNFVSMTYMMGAPNQELTFYEGEFYLRNEFAKFEVSGRIFISWLPVHTVRFVGSIINSRGDNDLFVLAISATELTIDEDALGFVRVYQCDDGTISGNLFNLRPIGYLENQVDEVVFALPNMKQIRNVANSYFSQNEKIERSPDIRLEDNTYCVEIYSVDNFSELSEQVRNTGGYVVTHVGKLRRKNGTITFLDKDHVLGALNYLLNFLTGVRTYSIIIQGFRNGNLMWTDVRQSKNRPYQGAISWSPEIFDDLNRVWQKFREFWTDEDDRDVLKNVIYWYVEANMNSSQLEGSIVMAQAALEALFNWIKVERDQNISIKDAEDLEKRSAQYKLKVLLSYIGCSNKVPPTLKTLLGLGGEFKKGNNAIPEVRNALVHEAKSKRQKLRLVTGKAKLEVLRLALWYIELILLKELEFMGQYHNRCSDDFLFQNSLEDLKFVQRSSS